MNLSIPIVVELCAFSRVAMHAPANIAFIDFRDAKKFAQNVELRSNRLLFYSIRAPFHKYCQLQFIIIHYALLNNRKLSINKNIINSARLRSCLYILNSSNPYIVKSTSRRLWSAGIVNNSLFRQSKVIFNYKKCSKVFLLFQRTTNIAQFVFEETAPSHGVHDDAS